MGTLNGCQKVDKKSLRSLNFMRERASQFAEYRIRSASTTRCALFRQKITGKFVLSVHISPGRFPAPHSMKERITMKSRVLAVVGLVAILGSSATLGVLAQGGKGKMEKHPELIKALRQLNAAKTSLQSAKRDFDGHREKAVDLTSQAIKEVELAIASDKK
jgi:hypothetical protein